VSSRKRSAFEDAHDPLFELSDRGDGAIATVQSAETVNPAPEKARRAREELTNRHRRMVSLWRREVTLQAPERFQKVLDADFVDGYQWDPSEAAELIERGQAPTVYNVIKPRILWLTGTEKRTRIEAKVLPRSQDDEQQAEVKGKLLKYINDVNRAQFARSAAFQQAVTVGVGWLEDTINPSPTAELLYSGCVHWREIWDDSANRPLPGQSNEAQRYLFRRKVVDLDVAQQMFPKYAEALRRDSSNLDVQAFESDAYYMGERLGAGSGSDNPSFALDSTSRYQTSRIFAEQSLIDGSRPRVALIEAWYRKPQRVKMLRIEGGESVLYDKANPEHETALRSGQAMLVDHMRMQMHLMVMTETVALHDGPAPFNHNKFPYTEIVCYARDRTGERYGVVRDIRDPQEALNKRESKALFEASANQVVAEAGAVEDEDAARREIQRPDAWITVKRDKRFEVVDRKGVAAVHLDMAVRDMQFVEIASGVRDENLGAETNASSGKAILARQQQGAVTTAGLFDNLRYAIQLQGEKQLSLVEQFYTAQRVVRIVGQKAPIEWLPINDSDPLTGEPINDISRRNADFLVNDQDYRRDWQTAAVESIMDLLAKTMQTNPQAGFALLDLVIDATPDLPNKAEFLARIRKLNGQSDPAAKQTPEQQQAQQMAEQMAQEQTELARRDAMAAVAVKEAEALLKQAQANKAQAEAALAGQPQGDPNAAGDMMAMQDQARAQMAALDATIANLQGQLAKAKADQDARIEAAQITAEARLDEARIDAATRLEIADMQTKAQASAARLAAKQAASAPKPAKPKPASSS
jgi:hypothetical protein